MNAERRLGVVVICDLRIRIEGGKEVKPRYAEKVVRSKTSQEEVERAQALRRGKKESKEQVEIKGDRGRQATRNGKDELPFGKLFCPEPPLIQAAFSSLCEVLW